MLTPDQHPRWLMAPKRRSRGDPRCRLGERLNGRSTCVGTVYQLDCYWLFEGVIGRGCGIVNESVNMDFLIEFTEKVFSGPMLPASVLLVAVLAYWLFVMLGAVDLDMLDFDLDIDLDPDVDVDVDLVHGHGSPTELGLIVLRFLNLGQVPLMVWGERFALTFWGTSVLLFQWVDQTADPLSIGKTVALVARNVGISLVITKILTQPLTKLFAEEHSITPEELIGAHCVATTGISDSFGQAETATNGAPLLLHVRSHSGPIAKGSTVTLVAFDPEHNLYSVTLIDPENLQ